MKIKTISQELLSSDCWSVQAFGTERCTACEFHNTEECGGKEILKTGKNEIGVNIGPKGMERKKS